MTDKDRDVFRDAVGIVGLEFTAEEQQRISELAAELKAILSKAKRRQQERLGKH